MCFSNIVIKLFDDKFFYKTFSEKIIILLDVCVKFVDNVNLFLVLNKDIKLMFLFKYYLVFILRRLCRTKYFFINLRKLETI